MAAKSSTRRRLSASVAARERHTPGDPELPALRAELATERIAEEIGSAPPLADAQRARLIRQIVDQAPPLSAETRARLRPILSGGIGGTEAARAS